MARNILGLALEAGGTILFAVSLGALLFAQLYPQSAEWLHPLRPPFDEVLPRQLAGEVLRDLPGSEATPPSFSSTAPLPPAPSKPADMSSASHIISDYLPSQ